MTDLKLHRVLVTGAAGNIGRVLCRGLRGRFPLLRLSDVAPLGAAAPGEEVAQADILEFDSMVALMEGVDGLVHLAGSPDGRDFETVCRLNIVGAHNVFEAAKRQGVKRVVFASSNHAIGMAPYDAPVTGETPAQPDSFYGISKVFGEAMLRYYADKFGMTAVCLRIGSFQAAPEDQRQLRTWLSHRDTIALVHRALVTPDVRFLTVMGLSANRRLAVTDPNLARLAFAPADNAEDHADALRARGIDVDGPWPYAHFGGPVALPDFDV